MAKAIRGDAATGAAPHRNWIEPTLLVLSATAFALGVLWQRTGEGFVAYDFYGQFYPWVEHARRSLATGSGFLWNPHQDCGQPFLANMQLGILYPGNFVFAAFGREPALLANVIINLSIAGFGMFQLCRTIGTTTTAGLCGALAFQLGWAATNLAAWSPTHIGPLAWLPVVLWRCERLIQAPTVRQGILLGLALTIQLLPGFPQIVFFTQQLIALRILWALLLRQAAAIPLLAAATLGVTLSAGMAAVQLVPSLEIARRSLWGGALTAEQVGATFSWASMAAALSSHLALGGNPFLIVIIVLGLVAVGVQRKTEASFYLLLAVIYFVLSLGPGSFLYSLYEMLPLGTAFRGSARLLWVTSFAVSVLVALASDAFVAGRAQRLVAWPILVGTAIATALVVHVLAANGLGWVDWALVLLLVLTVIGLGQPPVARWRFAVLPLLVVANFALVGQRPLFGLRGGDVYGAHANVFSFVRSRLTPQDRVFIVPTHPDLGLMPKSGTLLGIPNIHDYDPMVDRHYAEFFTYMRTGRPFRNMDDWYWLFGKLLLPDLQRPLFHLTAARYLIVDEKMDRTAQAFHETLPLLLESDGVRVYENVNALPRARYVSQVQLEPQNGALARLADAGFDTRRVALVDRLPQSGFTGTDQDAAAAVEIAVDEPERVVLHVDTPVPGFVLLADQNDPGWSATVNGQVREILRANHAFRAVEVPAGDSEVIFAYRPSSLRVGALVSLATAILAAILWRRNPLEH